MVSRTLELPLGVVCRVRPSYGTDLVYSMRDPYGETGLMVGFNTVVRGRNLGHYVMVTRETEP